MKAVLDALDAELAATEQAQLERTERRSQLEQELSEGDAKLAELRDSRNRLAELDSGEAAKSPTPAAAVPPTARPPAATRKPSGRGKHGLPPPEKLHSWLVENGPAPLREIGEAFDLKSAKALGALRHLLRQQLDLEQIGRARAARWRVKDGRPKPQQPGSNGHQEPTPMGRVLSSIAAVSKDVGQIAHDAELSPTEVKRLLIEAEAEGDVRLSRHNGTPHYLAVP